MKSLDYPHKCLQAFWFPTFVCTRKDNDANMERGRGLRCKHGTTSLLLPSFLHSISLLCCSVGYGAKREVSIFPVQNSSTTFPFKSELVFPPNESRPLCCSKRKWLKKATNAAPGVDYLPHNASSTYVVSRSLIYSCLQWKLLFRSINNFVESFD